MNAAGCVRRGWPRKRCYELVDKDVRLYGLSTRDDMNHKMEKGHVASGPCRYFYQTLNQN